MVDAKTKIQGSIASAALKTPPLPRLPKPAEIELDGKKYSVLLIPMDMKGLCEAAQKKGWYHCVRTHYEGYGYHVMTKNPDDVSKIGISFLGRPLDEVSKKAPEISPVDIQRYAMALEKLRQKPQRPAVRPEAERLEGKKVTVNGKVYEVVGIPYQSYGELAPLAIKRGFKLGITVPGDNESLLNVCGKESCTHIFVRTENAQEARTISIELLRLDWQEKT